jgi:hypothetical protein
MIKILYAFFISSYIFSFILRDFVNMKLKIKALYDFSLRLTQLPDFQTSYCSDVSSVMHVLSLERNPIFDNE